MSKPLPDFVEQSARIKEFRRRAGVPSSAGWADFEDAVIQYYKPMLDALEKERERSAMLQERADMLQKRLDETSQRSFFGAH